MILSLRRGPLDIYFRDCAYRIRDSNNAIEYSLLLNPQYNQHDLDFLLEDANENSNFLDIGSNVGLYALSLAKRSLHGTTLCIDANPLMAKRLSFNAHATGLQNLRMVCSAVSDTDGQGSLKIRKDDVGNVALDESAPGDIPVRTLASIVAEHDINSIHGLKIDIEGHEDKAFVPFLRSAPATLLPGRIVIEHPAPDADYPECTKAFADLGYKLMGRSKSNSFYKRST